MFVTGPFKEGNMQITFNKIGIKGLYDINTRYCRHVILILTFIIIFIVPGSSLSAQLSNNDVKATSTGTGFIVNGNGFIVTAYHVVSEAKSILIELHDGSRFTAKLIKVSRQNDLATLKINKSTPNYLELEESGNVHVGDRVFTLGYPVIELLGKEPKYTEGTISSLSGIAGESALMQISVPIQPGNSGGPLVNEKGKVVGVITATAAVSAFFKITGTLPQNVNWAINVDYARPLFEKPAAKKTIALGRSNIVEHTRKSLCMIMAIRNNAPQSINTVVKKEDIGAWRILSSTNSGDILLDVESIEFASARNMTSFLLLKRKRGGNIIAMNELKKYVEEYPESESVLEKIEADRNNYKYRILYSYIYDKSGTLIHTLYGPATWMSVLYGSTMQKAILEINRLKRSK